MRAATRDPGPKPWASTNTSLATTSSGRAGSGQVPRLSRTAFRADAPWAGIDTRRALAGSPRSGTSMVTSATTRVSTVTTPGISPMRMVRRSGARVKVANTSAKRCRS
jgi:hypothetical protein